MSFWAESFWAPDFWREGFWEGIASSVTPKKKKGRARRHIVEIDDQFFEVSGPEEAQALFEAAAKVLEAPEARITKPVIKIKTLSGKPTRSKVMKAVLVKAETKLQKLFEVNEEREAKAQKEIDQAIQTKLKKDEEEAIAALLLLI